MSSTAVTLQERRFHPLHLTIKIPGVPQLPIALPSPSFASGNEEINMEPFPAFTDICPPLRAEAMHCILHCQNDICKRLTRYKTEFPPCRCGDEVFQNELSVCSPAVRGPKVTLDNMFMSAFQEDWSPSNNIEIHRDDAQELMIKFESLVNRRVLLDKNFMSIVRAHWKDAEDAAEDIVLTLFKLVEQYFDRTMRNDEVLSVTPRTLWAELKFYLSTGLEDWMIDFCQDWEHDVVVENSGGDPRLTLEAANFGLVGAVSKLWIDSLHDIVLLLVLRDARVREFAAAQPWWISAMVSIWTLFVQFVSDSLFMSCIDKDKSRNPTGMQWS
ncbi:hypothetical protein DE146DRAFT_647762 [Phaeosphaeria sp. MPI-PUGE-AT-0046c]|nr:hypothetical protein DE146DRAFT_647762 [Phaeosphaeria sp. MPI-PUGE-AT-0046c]